VARDAAEHDGWNLVNEYLSVDVANRTVSRHGRAAVVVASNVFAHNDDIHQLMAAVNILLDKGGVFICEVHYAGDLLSGCQFDTVYHEHAVYYSIHAMRTLLEAHGLRIWQVKRTMMHAGSMRVYAVRQGDDHPDWTENDEPEQLDTLGFKRRALRAREIIFHTVWAFSKTGKSVWAYGAAGRCTVLLNWCGLGSDIVHAVVDASPRRVGRFVPGVHIPIVSVDEFRKTPPLTTLITAWNYADSIRGQHPDYKGWWVQPLPELTVR
jgi:hypothetical protein